MYLIMFKRLKKRRDREVITKGKNPSIPSLLFLCPVWLGALHKQVNDLLAVFPACQSKLHTVNDRNITNCQRQ